MGKSRDEVRGPEPPLRARHLPPRGRGLVMCLNNGQLRRNSWEGQSPTWVPDLLSAQEVHLSFYRGKAARSREEAGLEWRAHGIKRGKSFWALLREAACTDLQIKISQVLNVRNQNHCWCGIVLSHKQIKVPLPATRLSPETWFPQ